MDALETFKKILSAPGAAKPGELGYGYAKTGVPTPVVTSPVQPTAEAMDLTPEETPQPSEFDVAAARDAERQRQETLAQQQATGAMVGGGYRPEELTMAPELEAAYKQGREGVQRVRTALEQYQESPERKKLAAEEAARLEKATAAEQGRMTRLEGLGRQQEQLAGEMAKKVEEFKVDPNRMFGQGGERAMSVFALGLANVFANVGEAMQGKTGTNAVLGFVRDRIAQDIALQENEYQRMLQGYNVRRNGLMDAIQMVGNERQGAEALARMQALRYADQIANLKRGVTDAEALNVLDQSEANIRASAGRDLQAIMAQNVGARNQAAAQAAATAARQSELRAQATGVGLSEKDAKFVGDILEKADKQQLMARTKGLSDFRNAVKGADQAALKETSGWIASVVKSIGEDKDRTAIENRIASAAIEGLSPQARNIITSWQRYIGGRLRAQGGTAITPAERSLFDMRFYTTPNSMMKLADDEYKVAETEARSLLRSSPFRPGSVQQDFLGAKLGQFIQGYQTSLPEPPPDAGTIGVKR